MTSNTPTRDGKSQYFNLNSPPLIHNTRTNIGIVSQSQERVVSQSQNEHSPRAQFDHILVVCIQDEIDDGMVEQTPARDVPAVTSLPTPIVL